MEFKKKIGIILKSKSIQNSGWIIGQQCFQMLMQLIVGVLTARYLGPSNYGTLNYTASFVAFFTSIASLGMDGVVVKKIVDHPENEGLYLGSALMMRAISSSLSTIAVSLVVFVLNPTEPIKLVLVFLQSFRLGFKSIQILDSWFQRYLCSKYVSIAKIIACVGVAIYKIFLLATSKSIVWFALSNVLTDLLISIVEFIFYQKKKNQPLSFRFSVGKEILSESYHFIVSGIMVAIYGQMDKIMIGQTMTDLDVGLYTTAASICGLWIFVPTAIINSFRPLVMETKKTGNEEEYLLRLKQVYSFVIWLCLVASTAIAIVAKPLVELLYGDQYLGAVQTLRILIWSEIFSMIGSARGIWILCEKKNKYVKYYLLFGTITNLILNTIMIPVFGIDGAAIATLVTQIMTSVIAPLFYKETRVHTKLVMDAFLFRWYRKSRGGKK